MFCTGKEQLTCNSEKMGCEGCFYFNDENEIKVGDYARTKQGKIIQISRVDKQQHYTYIYGDNGFYHIPLNDIAKHSPNIIDLVKVGDYVNGDRIDKISDTNILVSRCMGLFRIGYLIPIARYNSDIKSIVTKEQYESVEFRLEE